MELRKLRQKIDKIDNFILELLNRRAEIITQISRIKKQQKKDVYSPEREKMILSRLVKRNKGPLSKEALEAIYREIMSWSLSLQRSLKVAYLGPPATFTHLAALKKFGSQVNYIPCQTISDIFLVVEKDQVDYGVVPIENSIEGAVTHTLDMFIDSELNICSQIVMNVSHNLLSKFPLKTIKRLYSNPQVFGQCRTWIEQNLPWAERIEVSSTTRAAQIAARQRYSGCIASLLAAEVYNLNILAKNIEDSPHNLTRFLVIGKTQTEPTGLDRTSILFSIKDRIGALHDMLVPFKKYKINLTKIESRPSKKKAWEYYFFVDLDGHCKDKRVKRALKELENKCTFLKILGSYPVGE
ncbi:MAG: prephenate dehydratase [Candidatus Omnitrophica bacterium]|nr:prephenate dehydratase [Candidatus Omnitrophota bacterium]